MSATKREIDDAFYGGFCCALSAACCRVTDDGTSVDYLEAIGTVDERELLNFARRNQDMELPRIRRAIRYIKRNDATRAAMDKLRATR